MRRIWLGLNNNSSISSVLRAIFAFVLIVAALFVAEALAHSEQNQVMESGEHPLSELQFPDIMSK